MVTLSRLRDCATDQTGGYRSETRMIYPLYHTPYAMLVIDPSDDLLVNYDLKQPIKSHLP